MGDIWDLHALFLRLHEDGLGAADAHARELSFLDIQAEHRLQRIANSIRLSRSGYLESRTANSFSSPPSTASSSSSTCSRASTAVSSRGVQNIGPNV